MTESISVNDSNGSQVCHQDDIDNLSDVQAQHQWSLSHGRCWNHLSTFSRGKCSIPHITSTMLQLLQLKGLFSKLAHEYPHERLRNIVEVCGPFSFKNISQESVRLRLFHYSLMGEACKWLVELPRNSITLCRSWLPHLMCDSLPQRWWPLEIESKASSVICVMLLYLLIFSYVLLMIWLLYWGNLRMDNIVLYTCFDMLLSFSRF